MILAITHPEVAFRDCASCVRFVYDEATGEPSSWRGQPIPRGDTKPPCRTTTGCPKGTPESPVSLNERNQRALSFHRRCEAVGRWPEDPIVEQNALIIQTAEKQADRVLREREDARRERTSDPRRDRK